MLIEFIFHRGRSERRTCPSAGENLFIRAFDRQTRGPTTGPLTKWKFSQSAVTNRGSRRCCWPDTDKGANQVISGRWIELVRRRGATAPMRVHKVADSDLMRLAIRAANSI